MYMCYYAVLGVLTVLELIVVVAIWENPTVPPAGMGLLLSLSSLSTHVPGVLGQLYWYQTSSLSWVSYDHVVLVLTVLGQL